MNNIPDVALTAEVFYIVLAIATPGFIALFLAWFFYLLGKRLTTRPGVPIAAITQEGRVKVRGKAKPVKRGMITPFFHIPCVWYASTISVLRIITSSDEDGVPTTERVWNPIRTEFFSGYFYLVDPTGSVRVSPKGSKMIIENRRKVDTDRFLHHHRFILEHVRRNNIYLPRNSTEEDHHLMFEEEWIPSGDDVFVIGDAVRGPTEYRPSQVPFTIKNIGKGMTITDVDYGKLPDRSKKHIKNSLFAAGIFFCLALVLMIILIMFW